MKLTGEYKGYRIEWADYSQFTIYLGEERAANKTFRTTEDCEKWIDAQTKRTFNRVPVYFRTYKGFSRGECTSLIDEISCWCVSDKGKREKVTIADVIVQNETTVDAFAEVGKLERENTRILEQIKEKIKGMQRITADMMEVK